MIQPPDAEAFVAEQARELADALAAASSGPPVRALAQVCASLVDCLRGGGRLYLAGNGGSAAGASHLAAEFVGHCTRERVALPAVALADSPATVTALGNDFGYDEVFARQLQAFARPGDVVILLSTSGRSTNVVRAAQAAREGGALVVALVGQGTSALSEAADIAVHAPSGSTQRIQEIHTLWGHALAAWVDRKLG